MAPPSLMQLMTRSVAIAATTLFVLEWLGLEGEALGARGRELAISTALLALVLLALVSLFKARKDNVEFESANKELGARREEVQGRQMELERRIRQFEGADRLRRASAPPCSLARAVLRRKIQPGWIHRRARR